MRLTVLSWYEFQPVGISHAEFEVDRREFLPNLRVIGHGVEVGSKAANPVGRPIINSTGQAFEQNSLLGLGQVVEFRFQSFQ